MGVTKRPGVAVVGSGYWGRNLVRNFRELGALVRVCDRDEEVLRLFRESAPGVPTGVSLSGVLADEAVRGVVLATPAEMHFTQAREALLAGRHVFVEKPLALDADEGRELAGLAQERGLVLMVGHLLRYHPAFERLAELVDAGALGRINYIYSRRLNLGKIRREENSLWSFAPHDISMILALAGEEPENVMAVGGNYLHRRIADVTVTHLDFPSGLKAHVFVSWLHPFKEQRLVVVGERAMAVFDDTRPWSEKLALYPHRIDWEGHMPVPTRAEPVYEPVAEAEPLRRECLHFLDCIAQGARPRTDGDEGVRVLRVLNEAQRSLESGPAKGAAHRRSGVAPSATVHESAYVDDGAHIGSGTVVWHFSHVMTGTEIGAGCRIGQNVCLGPDVRIGNGCKIQNNVSVYRGVTLEDDVFCGPSMVFTNVFNPRSHVPRMHEVRETLVRRGATLGANCTIVCGVTIGRHAFVGAGAVVTHSVPDHALVMGNPARQAGWMCACGERLDDSLTCSACGTRHRRNGAGLSALQQDSENSAALRGPYGDTQ
ncbi:UDP-2-acetamido-3-amino-2,3-dideoxy-glucuronate N-acetyltransferase [Desulfobaculum xiamenense]|uniref:UDP-2-acetamido-3-amino-2,3-dideoxy-glucuronate N-acetyltransferase n=1 Tax=Desulfobaculum xiamenense TaxID=995050 RepID=A0A846QRG9_9BACT|nr:Gfo/Idh/MocA family oxidoreductase [Desulfobaculum xiamenense]NJB68963.1 UDP-2-acetamido-3-amino-2,3-dideoxy-glucuronate N-acetyltransferase [Desulfobaculum xiamenense]